MIYETLQYRQEEGVGWLKFNRPQALNALNKQMIDELLKWVEEVRVDKSLRVVVVTGEGKAFVAGADIKEFQNFGEDEALALARRGQSLMNQVEALPMPVIAAVNGFALGGGLELALACDFIIASDKAKLGLPEVSLGVIPGYGGTQRLTRSIGKTLARAVTLSGDIFSAQQFYEWGLVAKVVQAENLTEEVQKWANTISSRGPCALNKAKQAINDGFDYNLAEGLLLEAKLFAETFTTQDQKEGAVAFSEKRKPQFLGK